MPVHDWSLVEDGIFHDFHHAWIEEIKRSLNAGILPDDYYALAEQFAGAFGPDVLTLKAPGPGAGNGPTSTRPANGPGVVLAEPAVKLTGEAEMNFYRSKQKFVAVRHVSDDAVVAIVEVVSPGNKSNRRVFESFMYKAAELLDQRIHMLLLDLHATTARDPQGIHGALWQYVTREDYAGPPGQPLTLASYEADPSVRAFVHRFAVGDSLPDMLLFLRPGAHVPVPLETTYERAFAALPRRWRDVLAAHG